jgi:hypothetical protein
MSNPEPVALFSDNWAYLKTELNWLDRVLMMAVSRQKRDIQTVEDFAASSEDRVTSHWWKGIIALNGKPAYDMARPPKREGQGSTSPSYAQQLEARIRASQQRGIVLALPLLRDKLHLSQFEKNVVLLALAPEINQRFGRLYGYLQYQHDESDWDLPTVDLCLRLLCRNDQEWQKARPLITSDSRLLSLGILEWVNPDDTTLLSRHLRLTEEISTYLLAESPDPNALDHLIQTESFLPGGMGETTTPDAATDSWKSLVLPASTLSQLAVVKAALQGSQATGSVVVFAGQAGTGKTKAAQVLAAEAQLPLVVLDLSAIAATDTEDVLDSITELPACVLLLKSAHLWFGRNPTIETTLIHQLVQDWRRAGSTTDDTSTDDPSQPRLMVLSTHYSHTIKPSWRQQCNGIIEFPFPDEAARKQLWRQAIPKEIILDHSLRWIQLARKLPLTGGEISAVTATALSLVQQSGKNTLTLDGLEQALALSHPRLQGRLRKSNRRKPGNSKS